MLTAALSDGRGPEERTKLQRCFWESLGEPATWRTIRHVAHDPPRGTRSATWRRLLLWRVGDAILDGPLRDVTLPQARPPLVRGSRRVPVLSGGMMCESLSLDGSRSCLGGYTHSLAHSLAQAPS